MVIVSPAAVVAAVVWNTAPVGAPIPVQPLDTQPIRMLPPPDVAPAALPVGPANV